MTRLRRPDGAELEWWIEGQDGPLVAIAMMAFHPTIACHGIADELARDHRVLRYDLRGTGASSLTPPYEIATDAADLAALVEKAGGDALANSPAVLDALLGMIESDYRTGLRTMLASSGEADWHESALRARLDQMEAHSPAEVGVPRLRAWIEDESLAYGRALGDRLWYLHYPGNLWFQGSIEIVRRSLPDARLEAVSEGVISSPVENANTIRRILAAHGAAA